MVHCALQVVKHMLGSLPVRKARIGVESGKNFGSIGNVRPCGESKVHQQPNNGDIGVLDQDLLENQA